ncbi:RNA polymerase sigma factor [Acidobacteriota bacterium]
MNEEKIILLAKEGDPSAFRQLYESNFERTFRLAYRYTRSRQDAEDVMQETFINAFRGIKGFNFDLNTSFSTWLSRICINAAIGFLRKKKTRRVDQTDLFSTLTSEPVDRKESPEKAAVKSQSVSKIREAAGQLSPRQQIIFDMRYMRDFPVREIAEDLQCSQSSVKKHLNRAVTKLRKEMKPIWGEQ